MSKRDQRYKLPKNWIVLPIIFYTFVFSLCIALISVSVEAFAEYTSTLKAKAETENTKRMADVYERTSEDKINQLLK